MKTPFIPESEFKINLVTTEGKKEILKRDLIVEIIDMDILDESIQTIYGLLYDMKTKRREMELYNFSEHDFKEIVYRAKAQVLMSGKAPSKKEIYLAKMLEFTKRQTGLSFIGLENETGIPHSYLNRISQKFGGE